MARPDDIQTSNALVEIAEYFHFASPKNSINGVLQSAEANFRTSLSVGNQNFTAAISVKLLH
jgi:hypothetical protein